MGLLMQNPNLLVIGSCDGIYILNSRISESCEFGELMYCAGK